MRGHRSTRFTLLAMVIAAVALATVAVTGRGQPAVADDDSAAGIVGSWTGGEPGEAPFELVTFTRDGAVLRSGAPISQIPPEAGLGVTHVFSTADHGTWVRTGAREVAGRIVSLSFDEEGNLIFVATSDFTLAVTPDGESASGQARLELRTPAGDVLRRAEFPLHATRIRVAQ